MTMNSIKEPELPKLSRIRKDKTKNYLLSPKFKRFIVAKTISTLRLSEEF